MPTTATMQYIDQHLMIRKKHILPIYIQYLYHFFPQPKETVIYYNRGNQHLYQDSGGFHLNKMTRKLGTMSAKNSSRDWWRKICRGPVTWLVLWQIPNVLHDICIIDLPGWLAVMYCKKNVSSYVGPQILGTGSASTPLNLATGLTPGVQVIFFTTIA